MTEYWEIFAAGCVGALVLSVFFAESKACNRLEHWSKLTFVLAMFGRAMLAGYLAASVLDVSKPLHAFLIGLGLDSLLNAMRGTAVRFTRHIDEETERTEGSAQ